MTFHGASKRKMTHAARCEYPYFPILLFPSLSPVYPSVMPSDQEARGNWKERSKTLKHPSSGDKDTLYSQNGLAQIRLPKEFRFLDSADADRILHVWGNEGATGTLGMIFPSQMRPLAEGSWGVVIRYENEGHINDDDADTIDYTELFDRMQASISEENREREEVTFNPSTSLIGLLHLTMMRSINSTGQKI